MTHLVELVLGIGNHVTLQWSTSIGLCNLQRIEGEDLTLGVLTSEVLCLSTPAEFALCREDLAGDIGIDDLVDISGVTGVGITNNSESLWNGLEDGEQRVLLQCLCLCLGIHHLVILLGKFGSQVRRVGSCRVSNGCRVGSSGSCRVSRFYLTTCGGIFLVQLCEQGINLL